MYNVKLYDIQLEAIFWNMHFILGKERLTIFGHHIAVLWLIIYGRITFDLAIDLT